MRVETYLIDGAMHLRFVNGIEFKMDKRDYERATNENCHFIGIRLKTQNTVCIRITFRVEGKAIRMNLGRWILGLTDTSKVIAYKNLNECDFTRQNLSIVPISHRTVNRRGAQKNSKSGIRGVFWDVSRNKWCAHSSRVILGHFADQVEAENTVKEYRKKNKSFSFKDN